MRRGFYIVLATLAGLACQPGSLPPAGQLVLYVNTDAPLPPPPGETLAPGAPTPLFDTVRIEIYFPGETTPCGDCVQDFPVDESVVGAGHASVGVVPAVGVSGYRARVILYTSAWARSGEPAAPTTLDTTVSLPPTKADGLTAVTVVLHTDDVGSPVGADTPVAPELGAAEPGLVGTWSGAKTVGCTRTPAPGEVCIPGGAYWMDPPRSQLGSASSVSVEPRLVVLSPFFLSRTEVTVAEFRASGLQSGADPVADSNDNACTFTSAPGSNDGLPLVCVSWKRASEYCTSLGGDLPSAAQFQYASSGLVSHAFVWGDDLPSCGDPTEGVAPDAEFGHSYGSTGGGGSVTTGACKVFGAVSAPGSGMRDKLFVPAGSLPVVDLAGNASEWGLEPFNEGQGGCWAPGVYYDPVCSAPPMPPVIVGVGVQPVTLLGGSIITGAAELSASARSPADPVDSEPFIGFRCARPGL